MEGPVESLLTFHLSLLCLFGVFIGNCSLVFSEFLHDDR